MSSVKSRAQISTMSILALAASHNRCSKTLNALQSLQHQSLPAGCNFEICLVDDGSSDGTAQAVRSAFPAVTVLDGSGNLFWAGGMRFGWDNYASHQDSDYLLVFNDDIELSKNAVATLLSVAHNLETDGCSAYAISGAFLNPESMKTAYGGAVRNSLWHPLRFGTIEPSDSIRECDTVNMNFTLINREALRSVGFLAPEFTHAMADFDFGLRVRAAGGRVVLAPGYVGTCYVNPIIGTSKQADLPFVERWRRLTGVKEQPLRERAVYYRRHGGWLWPIFWSLPYLRMCMEFGANFLLKTFTTARAKDPL